MQRGHTYCCKKYDLCYNEFNYTFIIQRHRLRSNKAVLNFKTASFKQQFLSKILASCHFVVDKNDKAKSKGTKNSMRL